MRKPLIMGNWKLNGTRASITTLIQDLLPAVAANPAAQVAVCPPALFLDHAHHVAGNSTLAIGAQNVDLHDSGAFTGETASVMVKEIGCQYALVGHSERRTLHGETDAIVAQKFALIQKAGLTPVLCIGETLAQFEAKTTNTVVEAQLKAVIDHCGIAALANAVIAYEPVWAIGTGKTATPAIAQAVHAHIRQYLAQFDQAIAAKVQILYGGSVTGATAAELFQQADIDGGLVGGASLKAAEFSQIIAAAR